MANPQMRRLGLAITVEPLEEYKAPKNDSAELGRQKEAELGILQTRLNDLIATKQQKERESNQFQAEIDNVMS